MHQQSDLRYSPYLFKEEFEILLNRSRDIGFDNTFYDQYIQEKMEKME